MRMVRTVLRLDEWLLFARALGLDPHSGPGSRRFGNRDVVDSPQAAAFRAGRSCFGGL
jgi:hypothetical protein